MFREKSVKILSDGGIVFVEWKENGVWLTGPTTFAFSGKISEDFLNI